jgi:hypothetical protein
MSPLCREQQEHMLNAAEEWSSRNKNRILKRADTESRNGLSEEAETGIGYTGRSRQRAQQI